MAQQRHDRVEIYRDRERKWRWRYVRGNGKTMADSGEGYVRRTAALAGAAHVLGGKVETRVTGDRRVHGAIIRPPQPAIGANVIRIVQQ